MNYGYVEPTIIEEDYVLGGVFSAPYEDVLPSGDWRPYLPVGEPQKRGALDTNSCTNFAWLNAVETRLNLKGINKNFSERFLAIVSGQTRQGNDPKHVSEAIRKIGLVKEATLPFEDNMDWDSYFSPNPMTRSYLNEAKKWGYKFKYEYVLKSYLSLEDQRAKLREALRRSPVPIAVYAWKEEGGVYVRPDGARDTHYTLLVAMDDADCPIVYDSYQNDGKWLKRLSPHYNFQIAQGFHIEEGELSWWRKWLNRGILCK